MKYKSRFLRIFVAIDFWGLFRDSASIECTTNRLPRQARVRFTRRLP